MVAATCAENGLRRRKVEDGSARELASGRGVNHRATVWTQLFKYNDTQMEKLSIVAGMAPLCPSLDAAQTNSALHMQVFKMPLDTKRTKLFEKHTPVNLCKIAC